LEKFLDANVILGNNILLILGLDHAALFNEHLA
jgi:hypothetical protein